MALIPRGFEPLSAVQFLGSSRKKAAFSTHYAGRLWSARPGSQPPGDAGPQGSPVSRSLLDTNIISSVTKPVPSEDLVAWMAEQADEDLFIFSLNSR